MLVSERHQYLQGLLVELRRTEATGSVQNWLTAGKVYLDYVVLLQSLDNAKQVAPQSPHAPRHAARILVCAPVCARIFTIISRFLFTD